MKIKLVGNKADDMQVTVVNQDTAIIPVGTPLVLTYTGTYDGAGVSLPSTNPSFANLTPGGIAMRTLGLNEYGYASTFGSVNALIVTATRANTGVNWTSSAIAAMTPMKIDTTNNALTPSGVTPALGTHPDYVLLDAIAAVPATPAGGDTRLVITQMARVQIRLS